MSASSTLGVAELVAVLEELGHEQVLPLGGQLDEAVRLRPGHARVAHHAQRVVLLLDEPAHGVERLLVLQPPVEQLPTELVPAVRAQVGARVELARTSARRSLVTVRRSGVDPADPARPTGLTSVTSKPSWSATATRMASSRASSRLR